MSATDKLTSREAQRIATRERLFTAAVAEFKRSGVAAADVAVVVEAAGVAHGTFFFHFPTKEHVVAELGQREEIRLAGELDRFLAKPRDLKTTMLEVVRLGTSLERRVGSILFKDMVALYFSPTRPELRLWPDHPLIARVVTEFERARERGEISADPAVDPANAAIFFFMGYFALLITHNRAAERNVVLEQSLTVMLRGLETEVSR